MSELKVGDSAPDFTLPDQDDRETNLGDYRGKWVVLYFYPRDNTPGCTTEAMEFTAGIDEFSSLDAAILGVSRDSIESHKRFIEKKGLKMTLLSDADHKMMETYGVWQLKKLYGKEYMGIVRSTFLIDPDGKIAHLWPKVKVKGHVEDVKGTLAGLR